MRIAIVTLSVNANYGGILQAYALQTVLERMGHEVKLLRRDYSIHISKKLVFSEIPRRIFRRLTGNNIEIFTEFEYNRDYRRATKKTRKFINKYLNIDKRPLWLIKNDDYDAYVVGSDQIWRPCYINGGTLTKIEDAFLKFTKDWPVIRIAYAASFGTSEWEYTAEQTELVRKLVEKFNAVSVRELSGVDLCRKYFHITASWMLDPTLLLDKKDYLNLIGYKRVRKGYVFGYILDKSEGKQKVIDSVCKDRGLESKLMNVSMDDVSIPMKDKRAAAIEDWLRNIVESDFVVTDSFHGCVFSIIFNKPFLVIANKERGLSRFSSLLHSFDMMDHLISDICEYDSDKQYLIPEYVQKKLEQKRGESFNFLNKYFNCNQ